MAGFDAAGAGQRQGFAARLAQVDQRERQVTGIVPHGVRRPFAGIAPAAGIDRAGGELAQQVELPLGNHPLGIVGVGADDAADPTVVIRHRAVGEGVVGLLRIAVALHDQELLLDIGAFIATHRGRQHRADLRPDLAPHDAGRLAQRPRMLAADDRAIGVVVEVDELAAPADPDRLARGQHDAHRGLQAARPLCRRPERRRGPVQRPHARGQLAVAVQEVWRRLGRSVLGRDLGAHSFRRHCDGCVPRRTVPGQAAFVNQLADLSGGTRDMRTAQECCRAPRSGCTRRQRRSGHRRPRCC